MRSEQQKQQSTVTREGRGVAGIWQVRRGRPAEEGHSAALLESYWSYGEGMGVGGDGGAVMGWDGMGRARGEEFDKRRRAAESRGADTVGAVGQSNLGSSEMHTREGRSTGSSGSGRELQNAA
jgi:hypothetical protein